MPLSAAHTLELVTPENAGEWPIEFGFQIDRDDTNRLIPFGFGVTDEHTVVLRALSKRGRQEDYDITGARFLGLQSTADNDDGYFAKVEHPLALDDVARGVAHNSLYRPSFSLLKIAGVQQEVTAAIHFGWHPTYPEYSGFYIVAPCVATVQREYGIQATRGVGLPESEVIRRTEGIPPIAHLPFPHTPGHQAARQSAIAEFRRKLRTAD